MEYTVKVGSRYRSGLVLKTWDSHADGPDSEDDHVVKRLIALASLGEMREIDLVVSLEVEVVDTIGGVEDAGSIEPLQEIYRIPYPYNFHLRKQILRLIQSQPKLYMA